VEEEVAVEVEVIGAEDMVEEEAEVEAEAASTWEI
jgi:hypothetical protein